MSGGAKGHYGAQLGAGGVAGLYGAEPQPQPTVDLVPTTTATPTTVNLPTHTSSKGGAARRKRAR